MTPAAREPPTPSGEPLPVDAALEAITRALRAPSSHNSQPWRFRVLPTGIELRADDSRWLRVVDPERRELTLSCGAALFHLELALRHVGYGVRVDVLPEVADPDLFARITRPGSTSPLEAVAGSQALFDAIERRWTHRGAFRRDDLPRRFADEVRAACASEGAALTFIDDEPSRARLADLVDEGDRAQARDPRFRSELASWLRPNRSTRLDGMPGYTLGLGDLLSHAAPFVVRTFNWGPQQAKVDRNHVREAPLLAVLHSAEDSPQAWLGAGRGLARLLLTATAAGVAAGFLNQPVQCPPLRERLRALHGSEGFGQLVIRFGIAPPGPGRLTPRRSIADVVDRG